VYTQQGLFSASPAGQECVLRAAPFEKTPTNINSSRAETSERAQTTAGHEKKNSGRRA